MKLTEGGGKLQNRLKELRARFDIRQEELAEALGCARETVSAIEANRRDPSGELVVRLQDFFPGERIFFAPTVTTSVHQYLERRSERNAQSPET